jgi:hypothetical protein
MMINMTPQMISRRGGGETHNTRNISEKCEDRRGDAARATPGCLFASIHTIYFITMMKRG